MVVNNDEVSNMISQAKKQGLFNSVRELIGLLTASAGIFAVLFYLAGRSYVSGYFGAMSIPEYLVSFSLQEYVMLAWQSVLIYPVFIFVVGGLFWGIVYTLRDYLSPVIFRFLNWLKNKAKNLLSFIHLPTIHLPKLSRETHLMYAMLGIGLLFAMVIVTVSSALTFVEQIGQINGKNALLEKSLNVELITDKPVMSEQVDVITNHEGIFYVYKDFRLLYVTNEKYYLFKEIDPTTCKPRKVFVIDRELFNQVNLSIANNLNNFCLQNNPSQSLPIPTSTP
jgi:hypothetical protein